MASFNMANTRSLTKNQLGGVIFGCKNDTMQECLHKQLFGLPAFHFAYVKNIEPGLPLFLFNYSDRKLHGIFEAASSGQMNINPYAWTLNGAEKTQYPAQVQIRTRLQCKPLPEDYFKPIIGDNYFSPHQFWFELDHAQTNKLISKLSSFAFAPGSYQPYYVQKQKPLVHHTPLPDKRNDCRVIKRSASTPNANITSDRSTGCSSSDAADSTDDGKHNKGSVNLQPINEAEKDLIYRKLKKLALSRERLDSYLVDSACDASDVDGLSLNKKEFLGGQKASEDTNEPEPVVSSDTQLSSDTQPSTISDTPPSNEPEPAIAQLVEEIRELTAFQIKQAQEMAHVLRRLDDAEAEICRLKDHCLLLESTSARPLTSYLGVVETESFEEKRLNPRECIYLIGGYDGKTWLSTLDVYSPSLDAKKSLSPMNYAHSYGAVAKLNGEIYTLGGGGGGDYLDWGNTVESYNVDTDKWTARASLNSKKGSLGAVSIGDKLFVAGGGNGVDSFSDVEMFDPDVGRWIPTRSMLHKRLALGAVQLKNVMYVTGGFDGQNYLRSMERFDPREHTWTKLESMNMKRGSHSMVVLNEKIYAMGGFDGEKMTTSAEVYDPRMGIWMVSDSMNQARGYASAVVVGERIYVIGGVQSDEKILDVVEQFEEGKGWKVMNLKAIGKISFGSAFVI